jgi:hypothetical protein
MLRPSLLTVSCFERMMSCVFLSCLSLNQISCGANAATDRSSLIRNSRRLSRATSAIAVRPSSLPCIDLFNGDCEKKWRSFGNHDISRQNSIEFGPKSAYRVLTSSIAYLSGACDELVVRGLSTGLVDHGTPTTIAVRHHQAACLPGAQPEDRGR